MSAIPGDVETDRQPPMTVPLRHFLVGLGFLLAGVLAGVGVALGVVPGRATLVHVHLLLVGWVCVTILGAMTQFVPVWSGVALHSRRLANCQLVLVAVGLLGFAGALLAGALPLVAAFGTVLLAGFWTFVYNVGRTMALVDGYDVTERHFLFALLSFFVLTTLGVLLALDLGVPAVALAGVDRTALVATHATVAVFGAVLTTVYGALYQLATMFTQTELHGVDRHLRAVEEVGHPVGVTLLAVGRLGDVVVLGRVGGVLVAVAAVAVGAILARKLHEAQVPWVPMHTRYAVVAVALSAWGVLTAPAWWTAPTAPAHTFGAPGVAHLLALGVVGFVVVGTLYHVVPFVVWVHRYGDRLGFEDVPVVDDLYDDRLAAADGALLTGGTLLLVAADLTGLPAVARGLGGALVALAAVAFSTNLLLVVRTHGPHPLGVVLVGALDPRSGATDGGDRPAEP